MKRLLDRLAFYLCLGVLDLAVGITFYTVTVQLPTVAAAAPDSFQSRELARLPKVVPAVKGTPVRIVIPSLSIDLPVGVGTYRPDDDSWTIDATKAYYADTSVPVNDSNGRTLIYGHAQAPVFASLLYLPAHAKAAVYTENGHVFHYVYTSMKKVVPTDTSVLGADGPPTLVLQTCTGPWDAYRALYSFKLESVGKI